MRQLRVVDAVPVRMLKNGKMKRSKRNGDMLGAALMHSPAAPFLAAAAEVDRPKRKRKATAKKRATKRPTSRKRRKSNAKLSRFAKCVKSVESRGGSYDARGVCAAAGRKKYGKAKFQKMATAGKARAARRRKRNVEMGFRDSSGVFHPIRASSDYVEGQKAASKKKAKKKPAKKMRAAKAKRRKR